MLCIPASALRLNAEYEAIPRVNPYKFSDAQTMPLNAKAVTNEGLVFGIDIISSTRTLLEDGSALTRHFHKNICQMKKGWFDRQPPIHTIAIIFAGRYDRMHILNHYLNDMLSKSLLQEVHVWDKTRNHQDRDWVHSLESNSTRVSESKSFGEIYKSYENFSPLCNATKESTVLVKMDDDIVFVDVPAFPKFVNYFHTHPEMLIVHANTINNGVAAYWQAQHMPPSVLSSVRGIEAYPKDGNAGYLWSSPETALELHKLFVKRPDLFKWDEPGDCIRYNAYTKNKYDDGSTKGQGRFSINLFAMRLSDINTIFDLVNSQNGKYGGFGDEPALTTVATQRGHKECMYVPFNAAHLSFSNQGKIADDALPLYEQLAANAK